jgi:hypothetical protein
LGRQAAIIGEAFAGINCKLQPGLQLKERDSPVLELFSDDALGSQPEAALVEFQGAIEIVDSESDKGDSGLHDTFS